MSRAAIYTRVSSQDQATKQIPIAGQLQDCRAHAATLGWTVVREFSDPGISGTVLERPGLMELIEAARGGHFEIALAWDSSRIARDNAHAGWIRTELARQGVQLAFVQAAGASELEADLRQVIAAEQIRTMRAAIKRGMRTNWERGGRHGGRELFGYRWADKTTREIVPEEAELVRLAFELTASDVPVRQIVQRLGWDRQRLHHVLRHPAYAGAHCARRRPRDNGRRWTPRDEWLIRWDVHPPIVTRELFERVQDKLDGHIKVPRQATLAISGLIHCRDCGRLAYNRGQRTLVSGTKRLIYWCPVCERKITTTSWAARILGVLCEHLVSCAPEMAAAMHSEDSTTAERVVAEGDLSRLERARSAVLDILVSGKVTDTGALAERLEAIQRDHADCQARLRALDRPTRQLPTEAEIRTALAEIADQAADLANDPRVDYLARPVLHTALDRIEMDLDTLQGDLVLANIAGGSLLRAIPNVRLPWNAREVA